LAWGHPTAVARGGVLSSASQEGIRQRLSRHLSGGAVWFDGSGARRKSRQRSVAVKSSSLEIFPAGLGTNPESYLFLEVHRKNQTS
jgi:hypothetical protein